MEQSLACTTDYAAIDCSSHRFSGTLLADMRRVFPCLCLLLLFTACAKKGTLPAEEVLRRAAVASQSLQSVAFTIGVGAEYGSSMHISADGSIRGVLQEAGRQAQFAVEAKGSMQENDERTTFEAKLEVTLLSPTDAFLRLQSLTSEPEPLLTPELEQSIIGTWWKIPSQVEGGVMSLTPDPGLLRAQSEVMRVTEDRGMEDIRGRKSYHYRIVVDREKLRAYLDRASTERGDLMTAEEKAEVAALLERMETKGELWVDAETFYIQKLNWQLQSADTVSGAEPFSLELTADFSEHNAAEPVVPPESYRVFSLEELFQQGVGGTPLPLPFPSSLPLPLPS